jgi:predicted nucleotidyltransferase
MRRSQTRRRSLNSVEIKSVDLPRVRDAADDYARWLLAEHPEVEEIIVFGSFVQGNYAPGSDLDVFIVLSEAHQLVRERIPRFLPSNFPVPLDIFPFTRDEMAARSGSPLLSAVKKSNWRYTR